MKKILALMIAALLVMSSFAALAADPPTNNVTNDGSVTVKGLEVGDTVRLFQVIEWKDNTGWDLTSDFSGLASSGLASGEVKGASGDSDYTTLPAAMKSTVLKYMTGVPAEPTINPDTGVATIPQGKEATKGRINSVLAAEIAKIAQTKTPATANVKSVTSGSSVTFGTTSAPLAAGLYIALIDAGKTGVIYNPVFVSSDYDQTSPAAKGVGDTYFQNEWTLLADSDSYSDTAMAKKETITVTKQVTDPDTHDSSVTDLSKTDEAATVDAGEIVMFTVKTTMPEYSDSYTWAKFNVNDKLSTGLKLVVDGTHPVTVKVVTKGTEITDSTAALEPGTGENANYVLTATNNTDTLKVAFTSKYILDQDQAMDVQVTYYAKITEEAFNHNVNPTSNTVTVEYSNNPYDDDDYGILKDVTNQYSFSLDAALWGEKSGEYETSELIKIGVDKDGNIITKETKHKYDNGVETGPLEGAVFGLFTDSSKIEAAIGKNATQLASADGLYKNDVFYPNGAVFTSNNIGKLNIKGLDVGTYYLAETKAPDGFIRDTKVYTITISADTEEQSVTEVLQGIEVTYACDRLKSYTVTISDSENNTRTSTYVMEYKDDGTPQENLPAGSLTIKNSSHKDADDTTDENYSAGSDNSTLIVNTQGMELPSTGGIGTTLFYIGGGILALIAVVLLVTKRRMSTDD